MHMCIVIAYTFNCMLCFINYAFNSIRSVQIANGQSIRIEGTRRWGQTGLTYSNLFNFHQFVINLVRNLF